MGIVRKRIPLTADTGTVVGYANSVNGTVKAVAFDKGTLVQANVATFSVLPERGSDTGVVLPFAVRSSDTGYDVLKSDEQASLSGDRVQVSLASGDTGEFGLSGVAYVYVEAENS